MKHIIILLVIGCSLQLYGQEKWTAAVYYDISNTNIVGGEGMEMGMDAHPGELVFEPKLGLGTGIQLERMLKQDRLGLVIRSGIHQRGALIGHQDDDYTPRYKLLSFDLNLGLRYRTDPFLKRISGVLELGGTSNATIKGFRENAYHAVNLSTDITIMHFGAYGGLGISIPCKENEIMVQLISDVGFSELFRESATHLGVSGKHQLVGLRIAFEL